MLRRFLSYRSRPDPDLIRENILNSNGEREKKGSPFSLFLPSLSDRRNYLHDLSKNISKLIESSYENSLKSAKFFPSSRLINYSSAKKRDA